jgi:hypothetical protein
MLERTLVRKSYTALLLVVLGLAVVALVAEVLTEEEAKIIVVPTLILVVVLIGIDLGAKLRSPQNEI